MAVALKNWTKGLGKVKQLMVMEFHSEIISRMEARLASIGTAARMGPLLGLLGTVMSMIAAFARMSSGAKPDPLALAGSISIGLWTTAAGLTIANPLMVLANDAQARIRRMRDRTERQLQEFLDILEQADAPPRPTRQGAGRAAAR
jgi:biopolymer transport protein ExbB